MHVLRTLGRSFAALPAPQRMLGCLLVVLWVLRLALLPLYPLFDPTEGRYAEIGRRMAASDDWVVPHIDSQTPFLGKPPLSFWATAASIDLFGSSEFAARLPSYLAILALVAAIVVFGRRHADPTTGLVAGVLFTSCGLPWVAAGTVFTDPLLALFLASALMFFHGAMTARSGQKRKWSGRAFFALVALGLMTKGLVAVVFTVGPIGVWALARRKTKATFVAAPWISGIAIFLAIVVPWHLAAESRQPGFLKYYIVGEHFSRFFDKGWSGDRYGDVHDTFPGAIWLLALAATIPWCFAAPFAFRRRAASAPPVHRMDIDLRWLLAIQAVFPVLFFTFSSNVVITYVMPGLPAACLLGADFLMARLRADGNETAAAPLRRLALLCCAVPAASVLLIALAVPRVAPTKSQKGVAEEVRRLDPEGRARIVYYKLVRPSAGFYLDGDASHADSGSDVRAYLRNGTHDFFVSKASRSDDLVEAAKGLPIRRMSSVGEFDIYAD